MQPLTLATSGIDSTVKLWAPTAPAPLPPGAAAARRREDNLRRQGSRPAGITITPELLRMLLLRRQGSVDDSDAEPDSDDARPGNECSIM